MESTTALSTPASAVDDFMNEVFAVIILNASWILPSMRTLAGGVDASPPRRQVAEEHGLALKSNLPDAVSWPHAHACGQIRGLCLPTDRSPAGSR